MPLAPLTISPLARSSGDMWLVDRLGATRAPWTEGLQDKLMVMELFCVDLLLGRALDEYFITSHNFHLPFYWISVVYFLKLGWSESQARLLSRCL